MKRIAEVALLIVLLALVVLSMRTQPGALASTPTASTFRAA